LEIVIQLGVPNVLQEHPAVVVTAIVPVPPSAETVIDNGFTVNVQAVPALCVTRNARPAIVTEPLRCNTVVLAATVTVEFPLPVPLAPAVIESQLVELLVLHAQPLPAVTAMVTASPAAGDKRVVGEIE
jgi:hypothetical protein